MCGARDEVLKLLEACQIINWNIICTSEIKHIFMVICFLILPRVPWMEFVFEILNPYYKYELFYKYNLEWPNEPT